LFNNLLLFDEDESLVVCVVDFEFKKILKRKKKQKTKTTREEMDSTPLEEKDKNNFVSSSKN